MTIADHDAGRRSNQTRALVVLSLFAAIAATGCQSVGGGGGTQVQFFAPPGASVILQSGRQGQIASETPFEDRLERTPEYCSVFNLSAGHYEFKYTAAEGLPGISVYGELVVRNPRHDYAKTFQRRSFVPISLPSEYYQRADAAGDEMFPYRGEMYRAAIEELDLQRLKMGDVVEKVFFVVDLEDAQEELADTEVDITICERELEYADTRFQQAYIDFRLEVEDPVANLLKQDRDFIHWEEERQELQQDLDRLIARRARLKAVLKGDHVLVRRGMLALATQEVVESHKDVVEAAEELGEVLLVMRIGGRHMQWGSPVSELATYEP